MTIDLKPEEWYRIRAWLGESDVWQVEDRYTRDALEALERAICDAERSR